MFWMDGFCPIHDECTFCNNTTLNKQWNDLFVNGISYYPCQILLDVDNDLFNINHDSFDISIFHQDTVWPICDDTLKQYHLTFDKYKLCVNKTITHSHYIYLVEQLFAKHNSEIKQELETMGIDDDGCINTDQTRSKLFVNCQDGAIYEIKLAFDHEWNVISPYPLYGYDESDQIIENNNFVFDIKYIFNVYIYGLTITFISLVFVVIFKLFGHSINMQQQQQDDTTTATK